MLTCSFSVRECATITVAAWLQQQQQHCHTQRVDVPSWAFSSPFTSPAVQQLEDDVTLAIIKPDAAQHASSIVQEVEQRGFRVLRSSTLTLSPQTAAQFYAEHAARSFFSELLQFMTSGPCTVLLLQRVGAVAAWRAAIGPTDSAKARTSAPDTLRAKYGTDSQRNAFHGSDSPASAAREISIFFPLHSPPAATRWHDVEQVSQARALPVTAQSEGVSFALTVVPSKRVKMLGGRGEVLGAEEGGAVVGDYVIEHGVWAPASTRMFHAIIGSTCALAAGALLLRRACLLCM
jgi:nucleoside diphosphate kinase